MISHAVAFLVGALIGYIFAEVRAALPHRQFRERLRRADDEMVWGPPRESLVMATAEALLRGDDRIIMDRVLKYERSGDRADADAAAQIVLNLSELAKGGNASAVSALQCLARKRREHITLLPSDLGSPAGDDAA